MKIKFTKASQKDKTLVTVQLSQFDDTDLDFVPGTFSKGEELILVIEGQPTIFRVNRVKTNGKGNITAASHTFPRFLRLPSVGKPVFADVSDVR